MAPEEAIEKRAILLRRKVTRLSHRVISLRCNDLAALGWNSGPQETLALKKSVAIDPKRKCNLIRRVGLYKP